MKRRFTAFMDSKKEEAMFTRRDLINLIIPMFIELFLSTTIGMADTIMVSNVGETVVSGVALVDSLNILLINIFAAIATGASVVIAQYIGFNDRKSANLVAVQSIIASFLFAGVIMIVCIITGDNMLVILFGKSEQAVLDNASIYFLLSVISYPFLAVQNTCSAIFRAVRSSKVAMYVSLLMNIINISGNAILIFGFGMGAAGAATATLISRVTGSVIMVVLLTDRKRIVNIRRFFSRNMRFAIFGHTVHLPIFEIRFDILKNVFKIGIPAGIETVIFQLGKVITQNYVTGFGTASIAANAIAGNIFTLTNMPGAALNLAIVTIVGQCVGASKFKEAKSYIFNITVIGALLLTATGIVTYIVLNPALTLYGLSGESMQIAKQLLTYNCFAQAIFWTPSFILPNGLRASGDVKYTMVVSITTMWVFRVFLGYVMAVPMQMGAVGVWISMFIDWIFRGIFFSIRFASNKWMTKKLI